MYKYTFYITATGIVSGSVAGANTAWSNTSFAISNDTANGSATATIPASSRTNLLTVSNYFFGTTVATYPQKGLTDVNLAVIDGIQVDIDRMGPGNYISDYSVQLMKNNGSNVSVAVGSNYAKTAPWPNSLGWATRATYGGPSDLWGTTWTAAELTNAWFGVAVAAQNSNVSAGVTASVQFIGVTVYWHPKPADVKKRYQCKVYNRAGTFLGSIPQLSSVFSLSQDINTAGAQISLKCPLSIDTAQLQSTGSLQDETGADLQDESGNSLLTEGSVPLVSVGTGTGLIRNGNRVIVTEVSYWYPTGRVLFRGTIENWRASIGDSDELTMLVYSDGSDLDNYMLLGGTQTYTLDQSQTTNTQSSAISTSGTTHDWEGQTFTVGAGVTNLAAITVYLTGTAHVTLSVYDSAVSGSQNLLTSIKQTVTAAAGEVQFNFANHVNVTPGAKYFFGVAPDDGETISIAYSNTGASTYAGGEWYRNYVTNNNTWGLNNTVDLYFKTYSSTGQTTATFGTQDPSTGMLKSIIDEYRGRGGLINYSSTSIDATGISVPYSMTTNTVLDGIKAMLDLSPTTFYWYVEIATNTLYFKKTNTTADVKLVKGRHINGIDLSASIENMVNNFYFSGGEVSPGVNLYKVYSDSTSIALYGPRLDRRSDNRVTLTATADAVGTSAIATQKDEVFQTTVTLSDSTIDTASLHVGQVVGFAGFGSFIDSLLMEVVRVDYTPDETTLTLGALPKQLNEEVERINRELIALQTIANPTNPS